MIKSKKSCVKRIYLITDNGLNEPNVSCKVWILKDLRCTQNIETVSGYKS